MDRGHSFKRQPNPKETTNIISLLSFFYIIKLFKKGYTKGIESDDLYEVLQNCRSKELGDLLEKHFEKSKEKSLCRALWHTFGQRFLKLGLMQLVIKLTITIWSPQAFSKLISYFSPGQTEISKEDATYYACVVIGLRIVHVFFSNNLALALIELGLGVKAAICSLIYRKSLRLNSDCLAEVTVGKVTTIINKDVDAFQEFIAFGNDIWIAFIQTGIICYLIYRKIGIASWAGVIFFFAVLPIQILIGKLAYNLRLKCNRKTDERLELTQEVLSAIKVIKMYTWEKFFETKICKARKEEVKQLHKLFYTEIWITIIGSICTKIAFFIFIMTYVHLGYDVTAEVVFYILSCFYDLEYSLSNIIPYGFSQAAKLYATAKRCETILNCKESIQKQKIEIEKRPQIIFDKVGTFIGQQQILKNASLVIGQGLNIVTGFVGSGKSVFLKTIIHEWPIVGKVTISGRVSYASQEPWLFPSTIRNNVLFGEKYSHERYKKVLQICCLDYDLALLPCGDNTVIGDCGINLSKGQQSRINLARAVYKDSDIYLLDDCLASLDAHVSDKIFDSCICKFLQNKLVVFVTNNLNYVQKADVVIEINQGLVSCNNERKFGFECINTDFDRNEITQEEIKKVEIYHESKNSGKVSLRDYHKYVIYGGGCIVFCLIMVLFTITQASSSYSEKLMTNWVTLEQNLTTFSVNNTDFDNLYKDKTYSLTMYSVTFIASIVLTIFSAFAFFYFARIASINMHEAMLHSVINTTMNFFDSNFIGNILTRFSKDFFTADEQLPVILVECLRMIFIAFGGIVLMTTVNYLFLIECLFLLVVSYLMKRFCQPTGRNLQRLHVQASIPMIGHVNSTLGGLTTIRACNAQEMVIDEFDKHQNLFSSANFMLYNSLTALSFGLDLFSALFVSSIIIQFLVFDFGLITNGVRNLSDCENLMTSVERILEYISLEQEETNGIVIKDWPRKGLINFNQISLNYSGSKPMLDDINFTVQAREKVGIVGRTGAGKSSIISSLLRLYPTTGKITIDGVDIENVSLNWLRSKISVIPQDPFLFSGTIRENMDPLSHYTDEQIWKVLTNLRLNNLINDLDVNIDKGSTLSAGQKQLFYLARVILQKNKIVVLDEATANVDQETDVLINEAVTNHFGESTVIVIAHRLSSVMSCNKVIVLGDGRIRELDEPEKLLQNKNSFFHCFIK
ncbi:probable multidrug resistance-associated protein lethal(2)03659 isoform X2 [Tribolium madens]|uniref:probable multidrug resistance-associated protein lethal(2)03659 isoform X2 n=1 Tax=Tribolium madens TaxID=41895 RepID=UPI001CF74C7B|nr:probable multidrug resistance-associated protein lethal(2)03659 isoform X2 [Tribolium madens]